MNGRVVPALLGLYFIAVSVCGADAPTTIHNDAHWIFGGPTEFRTTFKISREAVTKAVAGWMYLNLDNDVAEVSEEGASQNWVVVSMAADCRYSVDFTATALGNGCSPAFPVTNLDGHPPAIGPPANRN